MLHIIFLFIIAISLSMDAFSLSLAYGTLNLNKKEIKSLSLIVGLYHFLMPLIGNFVGITILHFVKIKPNLIVFIVLSFIGLQMIIDSFKEEKITKIITTLELFVFGFAVSLDSFSVGIGLSTITSHYILLSLLFSITSTIFTYLGLKLGSKINHKLGKLSTIIGGLFLIIIGFIYL